jgi:hypothetical protein
LSETLIEAPISAEEAYQSAEPIGVVAETIESRVAELDRILTPLVSGNSEVIVICPWLGSSKVTLREAMIAYPRPMIEEDPHTLAGIVIELLANRIEDDEPKKEDMPEQKQEETDSREVKLPQETNESEMPTKTLEARSQNRQAETKIGLATQSKSVTVKGQKPFSGRLEAINELEGVDVVATEQSKIINLPPAEPKRSSQKMNEAVMANSTHNYGNTTVSGTNKEINPAANNTPPNSVQNDAVRAESYAIEPQQATELGTKSDSTDLATEVTAKPQVLELSAIDIDGEDIEDEINLVTEALKVSPEELPGLALDDQIYIDELNLTEEEALPENNDFGQENGYIFRPEPKNEVQEVVFQLAECVDNSEPDLAQTANDILNKIAEVAAMLEPNDDENSAIEDEIQENLEELFTQLFDKLGIDYRSELIESLALQAIKHYSTGEIGTLSDEEETDDTPGGYGTHEIIRRLLVSSNTIRKAAAHAYTIGKSALHLYSNYMLVEKYLTR